jgi:hypothetical protein
VRSTRCGPCYLLNSAPLPESGSVAAAGSDPDQVRIRSDVRERATPDEYERFVDLLSEPIEVEEVEL